MSRRVRVDTKPSIPVNVPRMRFGRQVHVEVDTVETRSGDVVEYIDRRYGIRRCHRVAGRKGDRIAVRLHECEGATRRWIELRVVVRTWRWWRCNAS